MSLCHLFFLNFQSQTCQALSWFCCVLSRLLYYFWEDNTITSSIQHILKRMLGRKAAVLMTLMQKEVPECLFSELAFFSAVVTWEEETDSRICQVAEFIRCCMPGSFVDMLVDFAAGKVGTPFTDIYVFVEKIRMSVLFSCIFQQFHMTWQSEA